MAVTEQELDPVTRFVGDLSNLMSAAGEMIARVGRNQPISSAEQLRLRAALSAAEESLGAYQDEVLARALHPAGMGLAEVLQLVPEPVHVDLGLAEAGAPHQQAFPPCGTELRSETVTADELLLGDRAVPVEHMVVGPEKDALRHFHRIDGTSAPHGGQVVLGWGGEDRVVACDWPFARISTGRVVVDTPDGPEARYEWEQGR